MMFAVSNPLPAPPMSEFGAWMLSLMCLIGTISFLLWGYNQARAAFGRKPPINEDLDKLRTELTKLAPREIVDPLIQQLGSFATKDDIEKVKDELRNYASQTQVDRRINDLKEIISKMDTDHAAQLKEMRLYVHTEVHSFRDEAQSYWSRADEQREATHRRLNIFSEVLFQMRGTLEAIRQTQSARSE